MGLGSCSWDKKQRQSLGVEEGQEMQGSLGALGKRGQTAQDLPVFQLFMCFLSLHSTFFSFFQNARRVNGLEVAQSLSLLTLVQIRELVLSTVLGSVHLSARHVESMRLVGGPPLL